MENVLECNVYLQLCRSYVVRLPFTGTDSSLCVLTLAFHTHHTDDTTNVQSQLIALHTGITSTFGNTPRHFFTCHENDFSFDFNHYPCL